MKKIPVMVVLLALALGACLPSAPQTAANTPTPISAEALQATAAILAQQTLESLPTETALPTETPVVVTATETSIPETATETANPVLLTLTGTLGTGTPEGGAQAQATLEPSTLIAATLTTNAASNPLTPTTTPQPLAYGTLPPAIPSGTILIQNKAEAEAYISLRCVTASGLVSILEYPVKKLVESNAPAGKYTYVAWVGGRQFTGSFSLSKDGVLTITLLRDRITIK
jgi:hypothetical protein